MSLFPPRSWWLRWLPIYFIVALSITGACMVVATVVNIERHLQGEH